MSYTKDNKIAIVKKVKGLLESVIGNLQTKIRLSELLAKQIPYEYHYLSSIFSQMEGVTIEQYFIQLKIERIKDLLAEGKLSISEISHQCGYSSPAHLTNQFKRTTGATPSQFKLSQVKKK